MRAVLRQLGLLVVSVALIYALIWILMAVAYQDPHAQTGLNTGSASRTLYMTEPKYVFLNRSALANDTPRAIFIGASNTVVGFKQPEVASLVHGLEIDNLGVGGANITEMEQVFDLVEQIQDESARANTTYVISIWYGEFFENRAKWFSSERVAGDTDVNIEEYRYGFYRRTGAGPVAVLPPRYLNLEVEAIRPFLALDRISRELSGTARHFIHGKAPEDEQTPEAVIRRRNAAVLTEAEKKDDLSYWKTQMLGRESISEEQVNVLRELIGRILASGSKVLLVDLPIPKWHKLGSPIYSSYIQQRDAVVNEFRGRAGFVFFDMSEKDDESEFSDEVHPKPAIAPQWASTVVGPLLDLAHP